ncbi:SRPBCC family protein [Parvibaculum sp.]|uniref:SRPBCC family protein n=1 Tax=Parvibaculum sp. TaxID=2024848 RepID=UPI00321034BD
MHELVTHEDIPLPADAVWSVIGDFVRIDKWAKLVIDARLEETPEGKFRLLTLKDGQTFRERLVEQGPLHYTYTLPRAGLKTYLSTVSVKPVTDASSRIELIIRFEMDDDASLDEQNAQMSAFCRGNLKAMKRALGVA